MDSSILLICVLIAVIVVVPGLLLRYFVTFKWSKGPGQAHTNVKSARQALDGTVSYTCGYANIGFCELYINNEKIWCEQGGKVLFELQLKNVQVVSYSYWVVQFVTASDKYAVTGIHKPLKNDTLGALSRQGIATDKQTLNELIEKLQTLGVPVQKKLVLQKHVVLALIMLAIGIPLLIIAFIQSF